MWLMRSKIFFVVLLGLALSQCSNQPFAGYSITKNGLFYKINYWDTDQTQKPQPGDIAKVHLVYSSLTGKILFDSYSTDNPRYSRVLLHEKPKFAEEDGIYQLTLGDSATFVLLRSQSIHNELIAQISDTITKVKVYCKLIESQSVKGYYDKLQAEWLSRKTKANTLERNLIKQYCFDNKIDSTDFVYGIFLEKLKPQDSDQIADSLIKYGDRVVVHYNGFFTDGSLFDSTYGQNMPLDFTLGDPNQIIDGLAIALQHLKKGERAKVLIPSYLAFGDKGSAAGVVPPETPIVYTLHVQND